MKKVDVSEDKLFSLDFLPIEPGVVATEEDLFIFDDRVFKTLFPLDTEKCKNKIYILNELNRIKNILPREFIIPDTLIYTKGELKGFSMQRVQGLTLDSVLKSNSFSFKDKLSFLKNIGIILSKLNDVRRSGENVFINDLHSSNILVSNQGIRIIDLDSARVNDSVSFPARYLTPFSMVRDVDKYVKSNNRFGYIEADQNSDLYCYSIILLNFIFGKNISGIKVNDFYEILNFLESCGINRDLIYSFDLLIKNENNVNPYPFVESLDEKVLEKAKMLEIKRSY